MTFSRPGIGSVNIGPGGSKANTPSVKLPGGSTLSRNAQYQPDTKAPSVAYQNEFSRYKEIEGFLSFFSDAVVPFANKELNRRAKNELGDFIDQNPGALDASNQTQELIDARTKLSPKAGRDLVDAQGAWGSQMVGIRLAESMAEPGRAAALSAPGDDPETEAARAQASREAQAEAASVFPNPYQRLKYAELTARATAQLTNEYSKKRIDANAEINIQESAKGVAGQVAATFDTAADLSAQSPDGDDYEESSLILTMENNIATLNETMSGVQAARSLVLGLDLAVEREADANTKVQMYDRMINILQGQEFLSRDDLDIGRIPIPKFRGYTAIEYLEAQKAEAEKGADRDNFGRISAEINRLVASGDRAGAEAVASGATFYDPTLGNRLVDRAYSLNNRPTAGQQETENAIRRQMAEGDLTWKQMLPQIRNSNVSQRFLAQAEEAGLADNNDPDYMLDPQQQAAAKQVRSSAGMEYLQNGFYSAQGWRASASAKDKALMAAEAQAVAQAKLVPGTPIPASPVTQQLMLKYELEVQQRVAEELERQQNAGEKEINMFKIQQKVQDEMIQERWQKANPTGPAPPSLQQQFTSFQSNAFKSILTASQKNGGAFTVSQTAIDPAVMAQWERENADKTFADLRQGEKDKLMIKSFQSLKKPDPNNPGSTINYTLKEAEELYDELIKTVEAKLGSQPATKGFTKTGLPRKIPKGEYVESFSKSPGERVEKAGQVIQQGADLVGEGIDLFNKTIIQPVLQWGDSVDKKGKEGSQRTSPLTPQSDASGDQSNAGDDVVEFYNSGGFGEKAMEIAGGMLNILVGASPATAAPLENATPESLQAMRDAWPKRNVGIATPPLPQVAASSSARFIPTAITNDKHEMFVLIGISEGTRTASGGYTRNYYGHTDTGDGNNNRGTVSGGRNNNMTPQQIDRKWMFTLTRQMQQATPLLRTLGLQPGTVGWNRVMFNVLDLNVQSPLATPGFLRNLGTVKQQGFTVEAIAKARADAFFNPQTGRLEAGGFGNNYKRLFADQRSRAGVFDYRRRF